MSFFFFVRGCVDSFLNVHKHWVFTSLTRAIASTFFKLTGLAGTQRSLVQASPPHIEEDTCDEINDDNLETWWEPGQVAIVSVMMGDINAGVLRNGSLLLLVRPLPQGNEFGDVYIDDLVLFSMLHFSRFNEVEHCSWAARARDMYGQLSVPTAQSRDCWNARVSHVQAHLSYVRDAHRCRPRSHANVIAGTLLGAWNFALSFRREASLLSRRDLLSSSDASYSAHRGPLGRPAPRVRHRAHFFQQI